MKHALLVGVADAAPEGLRPGPNLAAMTTLLRDLGGWTIIECAGNTSTREDVVQALVAMVDACRPGDACLFYFFGHGGVVQFSGLSGELGKHPVFYIATLRPAGSPMVGVLDREISAALTRLDSICGNVTAILDCCHAASIVREDGIARIPAPAWVMALDRGELELELAVVSHPRIVRLFGSSSQRLAYAQRRPDGHHGRLTMAFVDVLREAELRCDRSSWDAVAHRVRERVSLDLGTEDQRVVLAGPRERLLFSPRTVALPRSAAFMPSGEATWGWLRAGLLQGVELGDRWGIAALTLGDDLEPRFVAEASVRRVELDRCEVSLVPTNAPGSAELPAGSSALLRGLERRMPVGVEASLAVTAAIEASSLLRVVPLTTAEVIARVCEQPEQPTLELRGADDQLCLDLVATDDAGLCEVVDLLEDRARAHRLVNALETNAATAARESTLHWRWGRIGEHKRPITLAAGSPGEAPGEIPRLHANDRVWIQLCHLGFPPPHWFVNVVEIGVSGRPQLLNAHEPEGIEVVPGVPVYVGLRGLRRREGLPVVWPRRVPTRVPRRCTLLVLASQRPISLGHLVRTPAPDDWAAFAAQGLFASKPPPGARGSAPAPPVATAAWTGGRIDYELDPRPR
jgi:hypothetical protein